jgi:hypothetical protein
MKPSTEFRTFRGWDVAVVAAIFAVVLLGWLTAAGGGHTVAPRPAHSVAHAPAGTSAVRAR